MTTLNDNLAGLAVENQVNVMRYTQGQLNAIRKLLREAEIDLTRQLIEAGTTFQKMRLGDLLRAVRTYSQTVEAQLYGHAQETLGDFARQQAGQAVTDMENALREILPRGRDFGISLTTPDFGMIASTATTRPIHGKLLKDWWKEWGTGVRAAVAQQVRLGLVENESIDQIVRRIVGTKARVFRDGALAPKRRHAEALVRTQVNHVANHAKNAVYEANDDVVEMVQWNSTLDGKTTPVCQARDGKLVAIGGRPQSSIESGRRLKPPSARPPAHINCRSTIVPVITDWESLGLKNPPPGTRASMNGQVAADLDYEAWLRGRPRAFIEKTLGKTKAALFLKGKLPLTRFIDRAGNAYTLADLKRMNPKAWKLAMGGQAGRKIKLRPKPRPKPQPKPAPKPKAGTAFGGLAEKTPDGTGLAPEHIKVMQEARNLRNLDEAAEWVRKKGGGGKEPWEYGVLLNAANQVVDARRGGKGSISYRGDDYRKLAAFGRGGTFTHSHPGSGALSGGDIAMAYAQGWKTMTAIGVEHRNFFLATGFKDISPAMVGASDARLVRGVSAGFDRMWRDSARHIREVWERKWPDERAYQRTAGGWKLTAQAAEDYNLIYIAATILNQQAMARWLGYEFKYALEAGAHREAVESYMRMLENNGLLRTLARHQGAMEELGARISRAGGG